MHAASAWLVVGASVLGGIGFFALGVAGNKMLRPAVRRPEKSATYESGVDPVGSGWSQIRIRYFLYAYLYVIFAVDAVYLFPWATVLRDLGPGALAEMGVFIGVLVLGLVYAWRRGAFSWQ